jgi:hypothetical protein
VFSKQKNPCRVDGCARDDACARIVENITEDNLVCPHEKRVGRVVGSNEEPVQIVVYLSDDDNDIEMRSPQSPRVITREMERIFIFCCVNFHRE